MTVALTVLLVVLDIAAHPDRSPWASVFVGSASLALVTIWSIRRRRGE